MTRLEYGIKATRVDAHASVVRCKEAEIVCDTDVQGRVDAFNPAELLFAAVAACILKNMGRIAPVIHFDYRGVSVRVHGCGRMRCQKCCVSTTLFWWIPMKMSESWR